MSKRLSPDTTRKRSSKKKRKSKAGEDPAEYWQQEIAPIMKDAGDENAMEHIAIDLFAELWKKSGKEVATSIVKRYTEKVQNDVKANEGVSGSWKLDGPAFNTDSLFICEDLSSAEFDDDDGFELTSTKGANPLVYKGRFHEWDGCQQEFFVTVKVFFDSSNPDQIEANIEVAAVNEPYYREKFEATYEVIGTRKNDE
mmetsp:Transcript_11111/g.14033  ORF Transcript_11111/g.14033 Transcript_11111/m.14033 type:complete len:198 (+) Transcript_11111:78-671(+)|eukprot:CAMPEP_0203730598 /NCGR_PEP_ID=MMETSP0092-20131115/20141_1 /ASSEMBLY_ACC=CAM_ASM_001090 /TAXON_ID=426623 /ORGANISM="Chaetoceros affinis, Strain CCMP159" /LENGTH=197 /DNA_ID=CAMNT_0050613435 /DNA_START=11 /DNA_END=604 /DNA_ORIENTATION=-